MNLELERNVNEVLEDLKKVNLDNNYIKIVYICSGYYDNCIIGKIRNKYYFIDLDNNIIDEEFEKVEEVFKKLDYLFNDKSFGNILEDIDEIKIIKGKLNLNLDKFSK